MLVANFNACVCLDVGDDIQIRKDPSSVSNSETYSK